MENAVELVKDQGGEHTKKSNQNKLWQMGEGHVGEADIYCFKIKEEKEYIPRHLVLRSKGYV